MLNAAKLETVNVLDGYFDNEMKVLRTVKHTQSYKENNLAKQRAGDLQHPTYKSRILS